MNDDLIGGIHEIALEIKKFRELLDEVLVTMRREIKELTYSNL